jgi:hypothetical protein
VGAADRHQQTRSPTRHHRGGEQPNVDYQVAAPSLKYRPTAEIKKLFEMENADGRLNQTQISRSAASKLALTLSSCPLAVHFPDEHDVARQRALFGLVVGDSGDLGLRRVQRQIDGFPDSLPSFPRFVIYDPHNAGTGSTPAGQKVISHLLGPPSSA